MLILLINKDFIERKTKRFFSVLQQVVDSKSKNTHLRQKDSFFVNTNPPPRNKYFFYSLGMG